MQKIVIIDDEDTILKGIGGFLKTKGYAVSTAIDGDAGLELLKKDEVQLLILDLHLKEGPTGVQVLRVAKMINPALKVIILTGFGEDDETREECVSLGADAFMSKPTSLKTVTEKIRDLLEDK